MRKDIIKHKTDHTLYIILDYDSYDINVISYLYVLKYDYVNELEYYTKLNADYIQIKQLLTNVNLGVKITDEYINTILSGISIKVQQSSNYKDTLSHIVKKLEELLKDKVINLVIDREIDEGESFNSIINLQQNYTYADVNNRSLEDYKKFKLNPLAKCTINPQYSCSLAGGNNIYYMKYLKYKNKYKLLKKYKSKV
jgi:hypothetical protein